METRPRDIFFPRTKQGYRFFLSFLFFRRCIIQRRRRRRGDGAETMRLLCGCRAYLAPLVSSSSYRFVISANFAMFVKSGNEGCGVEISFDIVKEIPLFQFRFRLIIKISAVPINNRSLPTNKTLIWNRWDLEGACNGNECLWGKWNWTRCTRRGVDRFEDKIVDR